MSFNLPLFLPLTIKRLSALFLLAMMLTKVSASVFWTAREQGDGKIKVLHDGFMVEDIVTGLQEPLGIAVDNVNEKVYWSDVNFESNQSTLQRANFDGSNTETIISIENTIIYSIAIDSAQNKIYWTDILANEIMRVNLDGGNTEFVTPTHGTAYGITLDAASKKLYWATHEQGEIWSADLNGDNQQRLGITGRGARSVSLHSNATKLYISNNTTNEILELDLSTRNMFVLFSNISGLGMIAYDANRDKLVGLDELTQNLFETELTELNIVERYQGTPNRKHSSDKQMGPYTVTRVNDNGTQRLTKVTANGGAVSQTWNIRNVDPCKD